MKHLFSILITAILCATASAQTIKTLGYNSTNGQVVANTNITFTNNVSFESLFVGNTNGSALTITTTNALFGVGVQINSTNGIFFGGVNSNTASSVTRTNLRLGLPALTNTSNVTAMRALAGSTNTNHPFSGTITIYDFNADAHDIVVSNGIITSYTAP
jgi:hypothetical protein